MGCSDRGLIEFSERRNFEIKRQSLPPSKRGGLPFHYQTKLNAKIQSAIVPALAPAAYAALFKLRLLRRLIDDELNTEAETNRFPQASRNPLKFAHENRTEIELMWRFA